MLTTLLIIWLLLGVISTFTATYISFKKDSYFTLTVRDLLILLVLSLLGIVTFIGVIKELVIEYKILDYEIYTRPKKLEKNETKKE
jgi:uncharacterized membrane protein